MIKILSFVCLGAAIVGLSGCAGTTTVAANDFGIETRNALVAQIVEPDPDYAKAAPVNADGKRASLAQQRYQQGKSIDPVASSSKIAAPQSGAAPALGQ